MVEIYVLYLFQEVLKCIFLPLLRTNDLTEKKFTYLYVFFLTLLFYLLLFSV